MTYSFDIDVAQEYGVNAAIMIHNFQFWIRKHRAENTNYYDGRHWTYNSVRGWSDLFCFWTPKQIRNILDNLIERGVLKKSNHNQNPYDRTLWYAFADEEKWVGPNGQIDLPKRANEFVQTGQPIPDIKPDNKPENNSISAREENVNCDSRKSFVSALPGDILIAIKDKIIPQWDSYSCGRISNAGNLIQAPTDEQIKKYIQKRAGSGWITGVGHQIMSIGPDLVEWMARESVAPETNDTDLKVFVEKWNEWVYRPAVQINQATKIDPANQDDIKPLLSTAKKILLNIIALTRTRITNGDTPHWPINPEYYNDPWTFAIAMFMERRYYSNFLSNSCRITPRMLLKDISRLTDPFSNTYLDDTSAHSKNVWHIA